jgi:pantothenate kinase-related protein Tda10
MSKLLQLLNRLKAQANEAMLTKSQQLAFAEITKRWQFPDCINLCGTQGSGKTFLGWVVAHHYQAGFYAAPQIFKADLPLYIPALIIDNAPTEEKELRRLLSEVQLRQFIKYS